MKTTKILVVCFVFLVGSVLLGGFSSKAWAAMPEAQKKQPVQQPNVLPQAGCMNKYKAGYMSPAGPTPTNTPGASSECLSCLQQFKSFSRPWTDAMKNCGQECNCQ